MSKSKKTIGATMLITGCCIGAGMIGLPVVSAFAGFMPSSLAMLLCYLFTTATGLLLLESTLWFDKRVNLLSISEFALGKTGKALTWILFLFLFYCLFVAFLDGGGQLFAELLSAVFNKTFSRSAGIMTCLVLAAGVTYAGTKVVDNLNRYLLVGLIVSYIVLISIGLPNVTLHNLTHVNFSATIGTIPILLICFGYQNLVPSITYYLNKNINHARFAIIIGNFIPFVIYLLWNFVILGMLPIDHQTTKPQTDMVSGLLVNASGALPVMDYIKAFSMFAILTSFLPCAVSFVDFIKDGLKEKTGERSQYEIAIHAAVFAPPAVCALIYPHLFLSALGFAGGFIDVLLFGVLPASVVLVGRYIKKVKSPYRMIGGFLTPLCILIISIAVLTLKFH